MKSSEEKKKKNKGNTKEKEEDSEQQLENQEGEAKWERGRERKSVHEVQMSIPKVLFMEGVRGS